MVRRRIFPRMPPGDSGAKVLCISAGYDAFGRELGRIGMGQTGTLALALPGALAPTPFARAGLWAPGGIALLLLALALWRRGHAVLKSH